MKRSILGLLVVLTISASAFGVVITDDFSDNNYTADQTWTVNSGTFAADGTNIGNYSAAAGMLNFGTDAGTSISLDIPNMADSSAVTIEFDLYQSNGSSPSSYGFSFDFADTSANNSYPISGKMTNWYGRYSGGLSGFAYNRAEGSWSGGATNEILKNGVQHVVMTFDPTTGGTFSYGGVEICSWDNFRGLNRIDQFTLNAGGTLSWFVDNVEVEYTAVPEPVSLVCLAMGALVGLRRKVA